MQDAQEPRGTCEALGVQRGPSAAKDNSSREPEGGDEVLSPSVAMVGLGQWRKGRWSLWGSRDLGVGVEQREWRVGQGGFELSDAARHSVELGMDLFSNQTEHTIRGTRRSADRKSENVGLEFSISPGGPAGF